MGFEEICYFFKTIFDLFLCQSYLKYLPPGPGQIYLIKNAELFFISEKIKKYRKCPALKMIRIDSAGGYKIKIRQFVLWIELWLFNLKRKLSVSMLAPVCFWQKMVNILSSLVAELAICISKTESGI